MTTNAIPCLKNSRGVEELADMKLENGMLTGQFAGHPKLAEAYLADRKHPPTRFQAIKRVFDVSVALLLMPIWLTAVVLLSTLVRIDGGPGLFGHTRVGKNGHSFRCWKIRTMVPDAPDILAQHLRKNPAAQAEWAQNHKLTCDPRITRIGHFLRRTSLDEIPQFMNVLRGEMSFVGPRPIVEEELEKYGVYSAGYLSLTPGITGLWQVSGRNDISYPERVRLDMDYLAQATFMMDLRILAKTVGVVLDRTGK